MFTYNFQIVLLGTTILGIGCGVLGVFMFHQKRALISDAISHATLPGITIAYLILVAFNLSERSLGAFIVGALISASISIFLYRILRKVRGVHDDAIIAILLSSFFGLGIAFLGIIQKQLHGHAAGLGQYIYGDAASMLQSDVFIILIVASVAIFIIVLFLKEIVAVTFDKEYAQSIGIRIGFIDGLLLFLTVLVTVAGLQAVGLILVISLFIIPALAAKYWTEKIIMHMVIAMIFAACSAISGTICSALFTNLPTGAAIVLSAGIIFIVSVLAGVRRGLLSVVIAEKRIRTRFNLAQLLIVLRFHFDLREYATVHNSAEYINLHGDCTYHWIADHLRIDTAALRRTLHLALARGILVAIDRGSYKLTAVGVRAVQGAVYRHQLLNAGMHLFPTKTAQLQDASEVHVETLFNKEELQQLTTYMNIHYSYLLDDSV